MTAAGAPFETYIVSAAAVALAELGDRTQLLAVMLASRYRRPIPILAGILVGVIANHGLAALAGFYLSGFVSATWFKLVIAASFIALGFWALVPEKADEPEKPSRLRLGVFLTTAVTFFLVEIGDKTQVATLALAARFHSVVWVVAGTTSGMMLVNTPAVILGHAASGRLPRRWLRLGAALLYLAIGLWDLAGALGWR